jgi:PmbA protein
LVAEHKTTELTEFGKKAIDFAIGKGAQEAEAYLSVNSSTSIDVERGQLVRSIKRSDQGLGVRAVYGKAVGFSYTNTLTDKSVEEAAERAFRAAKASKPDKNWLKLPSPKNFSVANGTYDKSIANLSSDMLVEMAADMLEAVSNYDRRVLAVDGGVAASLFSTVIVNSQGVEASDVGTAVGCSMETIARDGSEVTQHAMN